MNRSLGVYLSERFVGHLEQDESGQLRFAYDPDWLRAEDARPLSQSLPLRSEPFDHRACRPFFAGLLPEAEKRDLVARALGITARNDFAMLDRIGGECAGAVSLLRAGEKPAEPKAEDYEVLAPADLAAVLRLLPDRPLLAGRDGIRLSLAGAQDKLPVLLVNERVALPLRGVSSSHIVKPQIRRFPDTVQNEAFCLLLAKDLGLHAIDAAVRRAEGELYLLVARYDRVRTPAGRLRRLHQEDFCQALGVPPELKYQNEGGPSLEQCFDLLRRCAARPVVDLARLLDFVIFNFLIGNYDAHGKNYSIVYGDRGPELAPLYDVASTVVYPELSRRMAMKIGDRYDPDDVLPRHWSRFAAECGLAAPMVRRRVRDLSWRIGGAAERAAQALAEEGHGSLVVDRIVDMARARAEKVRRDFETEPDRDRRR